jgi:threonine/homoserine/homoserine lactone efflux protein
MDARYLAFAGVATVLTVTPGADMVLAARLAFVRR